MYPHKQGCMQPVPSPRLQLLPLLDGLPAHHLSNARSIIPFFFIFLLYCFLVFLVCTVQFETFFISTQSFVYLLCSSFLVFFLCNTFRLFLYIFNFQTFSFAFFLFHVSFRILFLFVIFLPFFTLSSSIDHMFS